VKFKKNSASISPFLCGLLTTVIVSACGVGKPEAPIQHSDQYSDQYSEGTVIERFNGKAARSDALLSNGSPNYLQRGIKDDVFYFVMPDRFHNGNSVNDQGDPAKPISYGGLEKTSKWAFHGGDIAGLEAKLDYLQGMGITAIWMTPILRNKAIQKDGFGHHGYWVIDFTEIDPHFGSNEDLKQLIKQAHARNIKVFFDIITNHTADVIKYEECHNDDGSYRKDSLEGCDYLDENKRKNGNVYTPFVSKNEQNVKVPRWLNDPKYYNNRGDSTWEGESAIKGDFAGLDDLDTSQTAVISGLTKIFKNLVSEFKPDGFRIDTVKHVDIEFWQSFSPALIAHAEEQGIPNFFMFGEVYDGNPAGLSKFTGAGQLQSVLDFGFAFNVQDVVFSQKSADQLIQLFDNDDYFRDENSSPDELLTFLGNHDMGRVGYFINKARPRASDTDRLALSKLAHALMFYSRGVPVVYYGDEQGFTGDGGDVDAREDMDPSLVAEYNDNALIGTNKSTQHNNFDTRHPLYQYLHHLSRLRLSHSGLRNGMHLNRVTSNNKKSYAFSRIDPDRHNDDFMHDYLIVFNFDSQSQRVEIKKSADSYSLIDGVPVLNTHQHLQFQLPPYSYSLVRSNEPIDASRISTLRAEKEYNENGRLFLPVNVQFEQNKPFNITELKFFKHLDNGKTQLFAYDTTPPYRAVVAPEVLQNVKKITISASNFQGQTIDYSYTRE
jgi:glycosidase